MERIYDRLLDEHDMLDVSYAVVRASVADRKPKTRVLTDGATLSSHYLRGVR